MTIESQLKELTPGTRAAALSGTWANRLGSVMELAVDETGHGLQGTYRSGVGSPHPDRVYPVTGFAVGDAFVFAVDFNPHGSVGGWTGHHVTDGDDERLVTLWHLARPVKPAAGDSELWGAVLAGADEFRRTG
ncbi:MAG: hypothetical protein IT196_10395 [Acidimicrobiales bacterium]|nr:hypothetical protein [Acidimicrobiales bacterium]